MTARRTGRAGQLDSSCVVTQGITALGAPKIEGARGKEARARGEPIERTQFDGRTQHTRVA